MMGLYDLLVAAWIVVSGDAVFFAGWFLFVAWTVAATVIWAVLGE